MFVPLARECNMSDTRHLTGAQNAIQLLYSFDEARAFMQLQGLKNTKEWAEWCKTGKRPPELPSKPDKMYRKSWKGWAHFLGYGPPLERAAGTTRTDSSLPFAEARAFVQALNPGLQKVEDWRKWAKSPDRPENIPADPSHTYKGKGWVSWSDWLGTGRRKRIVAGDIVRPFAEAREFARSLGLGSAEEYKTRARSLDFPADLPASPERHYCDKGWLGWPDFLGYAGLKNQNTTRAILESLLPVINDLTPLELYVILRRKGLFGDDYRKNSNASVLRALEGMCNATDPQAALNQLVTQLQGIQQPAVNAPPGNLLTGTPANRDADPPAADSEDLERAAKLPRLRSIDGLKAPDLLKEGRLIDEEEDLEFLVNNRVAAYWQAVLEGVPGFSVDALRAETGGAYFQEIKQRFLEQFDGASNLSVPQDFAYTKDGQRVQPTLMQRLTAYRISKERRVGNWSGVGAGKTVSAILAGLVANCRLTVVVAFNSTLERWQEEIRNACPSAIVFVKERGPFNLDPARPTFIVINYESFQQPWAETELIPNLTAQHRVDLIVLDEIQSARQRDEAEESTRRRVVNRLLAVADHPELHVLGMSATPLINDLHEARATLEMVTGRDFGDLPTRPSIPNAIGFHRLLVRHGLRFRPKYDQTVETKNVEVDGRQLLPALQQLPRKAYIPALERVLLRAKLPEILPLVKPGTLVYTQFVEEMVEPLEAAIRAAGMSVGVYTGERKEGLDAFRNRLKLNDPNRVDVLIGSAPVGTGIDGLQAVCDRLIFACLPWTSAEYQQIIGRLTRLGGLFDKVEVFIPTVVLRTPGGQDWSWDRYRLQVIEYKRTLADAALDGVIPEGKLPTRAEMYRQSLAALQEWMNRVS